MSSAMAALFPTIAFSFSQTVAFDDRFERQSRRAAYLGEFGF
jgi:hypothetical protein